MVSRKRFTIVGLFISYLSIVGISLVFTKLFGKSLGNWQVIVRESLLFLTAALLGWIIRQEGLTLASVGLHPEKIGRSILWALVAVIVSFGLLFVCFWVFQQIGWTFGESTAFDKLSMWTISLIVLRAGMLEELFFRGYIIERLQKLTGNRYIAALASLIPFALFHYSQGWPGIVVAFVIGGVLTIFYVWQRDLKSTMIAHFLIDFIPNVLGVL